MIEAAPAAGVRRVYWLRAPHCDRARMVLAAQRYVRLKPNDPSSAVPIDPPEMWLCEHEAGHVGG